MKKISWIVFFLGICLWPLSLFLSNTKSDFVIYAAPVLVLFASYFLYVRQNRFFWIPILSLPLISTKLVLIPFIASLLFFVLLKSKKLLLFLISSFIVLLIFAKPFFGQTIFKPDYERRQEVLRNTYLYPNVLLARTFQNKGLVVLNKFNSNLVALIDPTNYFFGFHPREIYIDNQNLDKFPFLSLPLFILGIYYVGKSKNKTFLASIFIASLLSLSLLENFDRNDFILFVPMSLLFYEGLLLSEKKLKAKIYYFYPFYLLFAFWEIIRVFVIKL